MNIAYVDEVGYGSIAGPVMVGAVVIADGEEKIKGINDSKKISKKRREELYPLIVNKFEYAFGSASPKKIERLNIHWARYEAMRIAVHKLVKRGIKIDKVIIDGKFPIPRLSILQEPVIKGDEKYWQVGAASILAKVKRDNIMTTLTAVEKYSHYQWETNAGYYTPNHRTGMILHGPTTLHRKNFDYFKYCLFCHNRYVEMLDNGKTFEEYIEHENEEKKRYNGSHYMLWKRGTYNLWKEIPYGGNR